MQVKLLNEGYRDNEQIYNDFINGNISYDNDYFSNESLTVYGVPDFPIYMPSKKDAKEKFREAILIIKNHYIMSNRDIHMSQKFWHSLLIGYKQEYLLKEYPKIKDDFNYFRNIVTKKFDWENYIYKCVLAAEYVHDFNFNNETEETDFIDYFYNNLDVYNYILKYPIFRNSDFVINFLQIIEEENLGEIFKEKVKGRTDLGKDERYGRRVLFELNKKYPVVLSPFMEKEDLKHEVLDALKVYY